MQVGYVRLTFVVTAADTRNGNFINDAIIYSLSPVPRRTSTFVVWLFIDSTSGVKVELRQTESPLHLYVKRLGLTFNPF